MTKLDIIYEDNDIIVVHKPAGIATQTRKLGEKDMESLIKTYLAQNGQKPYVGIVHRLDQPVEGVMVFAKNPKAAANLSQQVRERNIGKYYYAAAVAKPDAAKLLAGDTGSLRDYIIPDKKNNISVIGNSGDEKAQKAELSYKVERVVDGVTVFDIKLGTGRHHQIRLQLSNIGYPLVGDSKYGSTAADRNIALCSYKIQFVHPSTGRQLEFTVSPSHQSFH